MSDQSDVATAAIQQIHEAIAQALHRIADSTPVEQMPSATKRIVMTLRSVQLLLHPHLPHLPPPTE